MNPRLQSQAPSALPAAARMLLVGVMMATGALLAGAQTVTQSFPLRPGWNSLWLELEPTNAATAAVLAGVPYASVWTFAERQSAVDFIENPSEPVWNRDRWLRAVPPGHPGAFQNNLFTMPGARAYLVQVTNAFTLTVTGRPLWRPREWAPDAYTLRGFPVEPAAPPTFGHFFAGSPAHYDPTTGTLQKIYRLAPSGQWSLVGPTDPVASGEAYWVFTRGGSDYVAPLELRLKSGDQLDFGASLSTLALGVRNRRPGPAQVVIRDLSPASRLSYSRFNPTNGVEWIPLSAAVTQPLPANGEWTWRSALRRQELAARSHGSVLEFTDGSGTRIRLAVTAEAGPAAGAVAGSGAPGPATGPVPGVPPPGLWLGSASVTAVNEVNSGDPGTPTPTAAEFNLRLLVHVDGQGKARLLKEVTQLWKDGTTTTNAAGVAVVQTPGRYVLVTDEALFPQFRGATLRDGTPAGRRFSSVGYDFARSDGANHLPMVGGFGGTNTLKATIQLDPRFATNPFRHKYHPDHDNLDERFADYREEAYAVRREITLRFSDTAPAGVTAHDYGHGVVAGTYLETVTGLNKAPIRCRGAFRLTRVANIAVLDQ